MSGDFAGRSSSALLVLLHGAGSSGAVMLSRLIEATPDPEAVILAPDSRGSTWDVILGGYGPDVEFIDRALEHVFARVEVDAQRVVLAGFSDGASYVLSLGPGNGDLFTRLVAFSPGFMAPPTRIGRPPICVSHGVRDGVLPIDRCSRRLVPRLRSQGYEVRYEEFDGGHDVPAALAREALSWAMTT
jgi:phospholipase/carboxylesterase